MPLAARGLAIVANAPRDMLSNIPTELFDVIVEAVILREEPPPADIATAAANRREEAIHKSFYEAKVVTQRGPIVSNSAGLLRSNRALAGRTREVLQRLRASPSGLPLKLDILIVGERELWSTWTHVPDLQRPITKLDVQIRIADGHTIGRKNGWNTASTGPPALIYCFYFLLSAFLRRGPNFNEPHKPRWGDTAPSVSVVDHEVIVRALNVDVSALDDSKVVPDAMENEWSAARARQRRGEDLEIDATRRLCELCMRPERLARHLNGSFGFSYMLGMYEPEYGTILYERLGGMTMSIRGTVWRTFDIGASFAGLVQRPNDPNEYYRPKSDFFMRGPAKEQSARFAVWWYATRARRLRLGLPGGDATDEDADILSLEEAQATLLPLHNNIAVGQESG